MEMKNWLLLRKSSTKMEVYIETSKRKKPSVTDGEGRASEAFVQALKEKIPTVDALLLLSQQEERHLLERNVNIGLQRKLDNLQRNLLQVKDSVSCELTRITGHLNSIISEAKLLKTALGSSLPVSWSGETDDATLNEHFFDDMDIYGNLDSEKVDSVSAAGFEMVELLILAAQILNDAETKNGSSDAAA